MEQVMEIQALGYLVVGTAKLEDWTSLATKGLGMEAVDRGGGTRAFRMDDRRQRLVLDSTIPDTTQYFGWEVADADALDALATRLERAGTVVQHEPAALADQRFVSGLISFHDPAGNRLEAFYGAAVADAPFRPSRLISGFRCGPLGMGHVLVMVQNVTTALAFYRDLLGFRISDYMRDPMAYFLHVNPRHHSLALVEAPVNAMNHLMVELYSLDDVGQGYDLALMNREQIAATLGRHNNDLMTSFYMRTPSDFLVEYGWGGRDVDDATWQPKELPSLASFWGHEGLFGEMGGDPPPLDLRPDALRQSVRAPLQVIDGNYERLTGVCPWWDSIKARSRQ
jgi:2,3-dihydroxybiphenyl 1,2-dioxygenase